MTLEENDETTPGVSGTFDLIAGETRHSRPKLEVARARAQVNLSVSSTSTFWEPSTDATVTAYLDDSRGRCRVTFTNFPEFSSDQWQALANCLEVVVVNFLLHLPLQHQHPTERI